MAEKTRCEICNRNFKNQEGLEMHNKAKHETNNNSQSSKETKPVSKRKIKKWAIFITILLIISYFIFNSATTEGKYDDFAKCLTEKGVKMYGAYWCPHCQDQKKEFGRSWKKVNYIECSLPNNAGQNAECDTAGIQNYPTWEFADGERMKSVLPLTQLSQLSGCPLNENN